MITLGNIEISDDMTLEGIIQNAGVVYQQKRSVEGYSDTFVQPSIGGGGYTLGSNLSNGSSMGIWCQETIEEIKALELTGAPQTLNYRGTLYRVYIVDTTDFTALFKWELESPTKKYTGNIKLIGV